MNKKDTQYDTGFGLVGLDEGIMGSIGSLAMKAVQMPFKALGSLIRLFGKSGDLKNIGDLTNKQFHDQMKSSFGKLLQSIHGKDNVLMRVFYPIISEESVQNDAGQHEIKMVTDWKVLPLIMVIPTAKVKKLSTDKLQDAILKWTDCGIYLADYTTNTIKVDPLKHTMALIKSVAVAKENIDGAEKLAKDNLKAMVEMMSKEQLKHRFDSQSKGKVATNAYKLFGFLEDAKDITDKDISEIFSDMHDFFDVIGKLAKEHLNLLKLSDSFDRKEADVKTNSAKFARLSLIEKGETDNSKTFQVVLRTDGTANQKWVIENHSKSIPSEVKNAYENKLSISWDSNKFKNFIKISNMEFTIRNKFELSITDPKTDEDEIAEFMQHQPKPTDAEKPKEVPAVVESAICFGDLLKEAVNDQDALETSDLKDDKGVSGEQNLATLATIRYQTLYRLNMFNTGAKFGNGEGEIAKFMNHIKQSVNITTNIIKTSVIKIGYLTYNLVGGSIISTLTDQSKFVKDSQEINSVDLKAIENGDENADQSKPTDNDMKLIEKYTTSIDSLTSDEIKLNDGKNYLFRSNLKLVESVETFSDLFEEDANEPSWMLCRVESATDEFVIVKTNTKQVNTRFKIADIKKGDTIKLGENDFVIDSIFVETKEPTSDTTTIPTDFKLVSDGLEVADLPNEFYIEIKPEDNSLLESDGNVHWVGFLQKEGTKFTINSTNILKLDKTQEVDFPDGVNKNNKIKLEKVGGEFFEIEPLRILIKGEEKPTEGVAEVDSDIDLMLNNDEIKKIMGEI